MCKHELLKRADSETAPILWKHGAIARLGNHESIEPLLKDGYSTLSLGYVGVYEAVYALIGESNTSEKGIKLARRILKTLESTANKWKEETGLGFSVYGTPK